MIARIGTLLVALLLTASVLVGVSVVGSAPAQASTGFGYDNQDPVATGCANDAYTANASYITRGGGIVGLLEIRYSPRCGTNWGRMTSYEGAETMLIDVWRTFPWRYLREEGYYGTGWTNMVYARGVTACVAGHMEGTDRSQTCA